MKVTHLISRFPPHLGGMERQAFRLCSELTKKDIRIDVLTERYSTSLPAQERNNGLTIHRWGNGASGASSAFGYLIKSLLFFSNAAHRPDIYHAHMIASPSVTASLAKKLFGGKVITKIACSGEWGDLTTAKQTPLGRLKLDITLKNTDCFIAVSKEVEQELLAAGVSAERIAAIPNGVDTVRFHPSTTNKKDLQIQCGLTPGRWLLFSGRLTEQKQPQMLLEVFRKLATEFAQVNLLLLGEGPDRGKLQKYVDDHNLQERVIIKSVDDDIATYYQACDIFVLPSSAEGLSNSLLEAMASGMVCVATIIGGNTDMIQHNINGFLFPAHKPQDLMATLMQVLNVWVRQPEEMQKLAEKAREAMEKNYAVPVIVDQYERLYQRLKAS